MSENAPDWTAIESSPEFRELSRSRQRFAFVAGGLGVGAAAVYIVVVHTARGAMEAKAIGGMSVGFLLGVLLVFVTFAITRLYASRSQKVWGPMERSIREQWGSQR